MHPSIDQHRTEIAQLCHRYGVRQLEVFGSAARSTDFDPDRSDADFLVDFVPSNDPLQQYFGFAEELERLLRRPIDLVERNTIEASRNYIRRRRILAEAEPVYG
jgi:predicted nucleotidyltransferase